MTTPESSENRETVGSGTAESVAAPRRDWQGNYVEQREYALHPQTRELRADDRAATWGKRPDAAPVREFPTLSAESPETVRQNFDRQFKDERTGRCTK